jgi:hypothetical protein
MDFLTDKYKLDQLLLFFAAEFRGFGLENLRFGSLPGLSSGSTEDSVLRTSGKFIELLALVFFGALAFSVSGSGIGDSLYDDIIDSSG